MFKKMLKNYETVTLKSLARERNRVYKELENIGALELIQYADELDDAMKSQLSLMGIKKTANIRLNIKQYIQFAYSKAIIQVDGKKVKEAFPNDWEERFGKERSESFQKRGVKEYDETSNIVFIEL